MDWADLFGRGGSVEERPNPMVRAVLRPVETHFEEGYRTRADGTVVISTYLRQRAIALGVPPDEILCLPDGADVDRLQPIARGDARRALGLPEQPPIIGYIGAIFRRDAELMASAFDLVRQARPDARLLLAGYFNAPFESLTAYPQAVQRTGPIPRDRVALYLSACDLCWLPMCDSIANRARYPLKVKDYMCVARPVVITDVGDVAALVRDGGFGLTAADRAEDVAAKALALLADPEAAAAMGARGRRLAETEHTWDRFAERLEAFYRQVVDRGNS
jgi:phosphatidylinositol alpha-1,6-mannosyltransferase